MSKIILDPGHESQQQPSEKPRFDLGPMASEAPKSEPTFDVIKHGNTDSFVKDVIEASEKQPVIVQFWAADSQSCAGLSEQLEKIVRRTGGLVCMVKLNIHENQALAQQLQIQSVPTVYAFKDGRPVDAFAGVQGEAQLQSFIDKLIGDAVPPIEAAMRQALDCLNQGNCLEAEEIYTTILSQDSSYVPALAGMIRAIAGVPDFDRAQDIIDALDPKTKASPEISQALSVLELAKQSAQTQPSEILELERTVNADPKNLDARLKLAQTLFAAQQTEHAIDHLLEIVRQNRHWNDEAGRKQLIKIFDAIGPTEPLVAQARKRLSAVLFS